MNCVAVERTSTGLSTCRNRAMHGSVFCLMHEPPSEDEAKARAVLKAFEPFKILLPPKSVLIDLYESI